MMASPELAELAELAACLKNSISHDENSRKLAEQRLEQSSSTEPDFALKLLKLILNPSAAGDMSTCQAAAVYFKNFINKRYDPYDETIVAPLPDDEKQKLRSVIISSAVNSHHLVRPQLVTSVEKMIRADFPKKWPSLLDELHPIITSVDAGTVQIGLVIFLALVSWQGGSNAENIKEVVHGKFFQILLSILQNHLAAAEGAQLDSVLIVKSIIKCYNAAIQYRFSNHLMMGEPFSAWCTAITRVITFPVPQSIISLSREEAEAHGYWKMKKWAIRVHNKIFTRYGCSKLDSFNNSECPEFAKLYMTQVAVPILQVYLQQVESTIKGVNPVPERVFCLTVDYFESAIRVNKLWSILQPHALNILGHYCFPHVRFSDEDEELFEDDPEEFIRTRLDPFEIYYSFSSSAVSFMNDLLKCRKKSMFVPVLQFINQQLQTPSATKAGACTKDGAMFLLGSIARVLSSSSLSNQIESVIVSYILPELKSEYGFLRMRACWAIEQYDNVKFTPATSMSMFQAILGCMKDKLLPVRVAACSALGAIVENEAIQQAMIPLLPQVMETILCLANEIQLDSIAFVIERLVQLFSEHLAPYAVELSMHLRNTVVRHLEGYKNVLDGDVDDENFGQGTEQMMAIVGMFNAIDCIIEHMAKSPEIVARLEEIVVPLIALVFERQVLDVYEEVFELIDSIAFSRKTVSPAMWALLPYIHRVFKEAGCDYIQDMHTCLDNMISYAGARLFEGQKEGLMIILDIITTIMTDESFVEHDRIYGCKLMESLLLNCRGMVDEQVPSFIEMTLKSLLEDESNLPALTVLVPHLQVILNALYYNCPLALASLERVQGTGMTFNILCKYSTKMKRVHDKRLLIVGILAILAQPYNALPSILQQNYGSLMPPLLYSLQTLPKAMEERKRLEAKDDESLDESDFEGLADEKDYEELDDEDEEENVYTPTSRSQTLADHGDYDDDDDDENNEDYNGFEDELDEELFFETPLDNLDIPSIAQQALRSLSTGQAQSFARLTQSLPADQAAFLRTIL